MIKRKSKTKTLKRRCNPRDHEQVSVNGKLVDKGIAPLLKLIWKHKIETTNSCEDNQPGLIWIEFLNMKNLTKFLNLIAKYPNKNEVFWKTMYSRIMGNSDEKDNWKYDIHPINWGVDEEIVDDEAIETFSGKHDIDFTISVRFSKKEVPEIMKALK